MIVTSVIDDPARHPDPAAVHAELRRLGPHRTRDGRWFHEGDPIDFYSTVLEGAKLLHAFGECPCVIGQKITLDTAAPCHLIRVMLADDAACYPEISGSKHRFTVRFLELPDLDARPAQTRDDVPFRLVCCVF